MSREGKPHSPPFEKRYVRRARKSAGVLPPLAQSLAESYVGIEQLKTVLNLILLPVLFTSELQEPEDERIQPIKLLKKQLDQQDTSITAIDK